MKITLAVLLMSLTTNTLSFSYSPHVICRKPFLCSLTRQVPRAIRPGSSFLPNPWIQTPRWRETALNAEESRGSSHAGVQARINYLIEKLLSKGTVTQFVVLVIISAVIVACGALLIWIAALGSGTLEYAISKSYLLLFRSHLVHRAAKNTNQHISAGCPETIPWSPLQPPPSS